MNTAQPQQEKLRSELAEIKNEIGRLREVAAKASAEKLNQYLDSLEEKRDQVQKGLESIKDSSSDAFDDIRNGLKDTKQRLAIAKRAAEARFH